MRKNEADRLRDIADVLDDHCNDLSKDSTNREAHWFHWGAEEIRKVIFNSGFRCFSDVESGTTTTHANYGTTTTHQSNKEDE